MREEAYKSVGDTLKYVFKFTTDEDGVCVADRLYNVELIAAASVDSDAVFDDIQRDDDLTRHANVATFPAQSNGTV